MTKKFTIALLSCLLFGVTYAQNCNIGNQNKTAAFGKDSEFGIDFLMGIKKKLSEQATLRAINMIGNNTKVRFKMAVYSDNAGKPNKLIAQTEIGIVEEGIVSLPVPETLLPAGDYWIVSVYEPSNKSNYNSDMNVNATNSIYFSAPHPFKNALPTTLTGTTNYKGIDLLYFLSLDCGNTLSAENFEYNNSISIYPNPSSDSITVTGVSSGASYAILNTSGNTVSNGSINSNNIININSLSNGIYFIRLDDGNVLRFVKN